MSDPEIYPVPAELAARALPRAHFALIDRLAQMNARIADALSRHRTDEVDIHGLRTRGAGHLSFAAMHVLVPGAWSVRRAHDIVEGIERALEDEFDDLTVTTHIEPREDPRAYMERTFEEVAGYDELIVLRDIEYESHCEHHMAPIIGRVHVGYLPAGKVVGISKLARVVEAYARRFQVQEKMTAQIAQCIQDVLQPIGVGVVVEGAHECMTTRGIHKPGVNMVTSRMLGAFRTDPSTRREFLAMIGSPSGNGIGG